MKIVKHSPPPVPPAATYDLLNIEEREVAALVTILRSVGGDPAGPRGVVEHILAAFAAAGVNVAKNHYSTVKGPNAVPGEITFTSKATEEYRNTYRSPMQPTAAQQGAEDLNVMQMRDRAISLGVPERLLR